MSNLERDMKINGHNLETTIFNTFEKKEKNAEQLS